MCAHRVLHTSYVVRSRANLTKSLRLYAIWRRVSSQPRISDLMRGKINLFSLDALVNMATATGLHIDMRVLEAA